MTDVDGLERVECWRCGYQRLIFESCPECGGSCKPLTKEKQRVSDADGHDSGARCPSCNKFFADAEPGAEDYCWNTEEHVELEAVDDGGDGE